MSLKPRTQTALVGTADGGIEVSHSAPIPDTVDDRIIIKTKAVSVNPVDTKMIGPYVTPGAVAGFDFAGIVEEVGPASKYDFKPGDRVCTAVVGMNPCDPTVGAFAEYTSVVDWFLLKLPPSLSFEEGASLGISFMTTGLALFHSLALPGNPTEPTTHPVPVLVFGGSSATGTAAIQLLKLAGYQPIATCSPHNFELVRSYGASAVFDYKSPGCSSEIRKFTRNGLRYALDCISTTASMQFCYQAIGRAGGKYTALEPYSEAVAKTRRAIKADWIMGPQLLGQEIAWPEPHWRPADSTIADFGAGWTAIVNKLLEMELIRPHPILSRPGGLEGVLKGIEDIRSKKISGKKLVYTV